MRFAELGILAGLCGRAWRRRTIASLYTALLLVALLLLGGCALPGMGLAAPAQLAPTATPTLWMGAPRGLPTGWKVYHATHFTLALPADWEFSKSDEPQDSIPPAPPPFIYMMDMSPNILSGLVYEWDGLTPAQVHDDFCTSTADDTVVTMAGLPMRFSVGYGPLGSGSSYNPFEYEWIFISNHGSVYWFDFYTDSLPVDAGTPLYSAHVARLILNTFAPQYATWGCA
jgi:hypothetical protein